MTSLEHRSRAPDFEGDQLATVIEAYLGSKEDVGVPEQDVINSWKQMCDLQEFMEPQVWMAGLVEMWVTGLNVFATGATGIALSSQKNVASPFFLPMIGGFVGAMTLPLFIFAALPASGGHINPLITLGSFAIRASSLPRTIIYIIGQTVGATVGAGFLHVGLGHKTLVSAFIPGCTWNPDGSVNPLQSFVFESVACAILLCVSFAAGLDPRQGKVFGRVLGPIMIGLTLGITIFITGIAKPEYSGASMNPGRCFGLLAATGNFQNHYIQWAGSLVAAAASGLVYLAMPPYKSKKIVTAISGDVVVSGV